MMPVSLSTDRIGLVTFAPVASALGRGRGEWMSEAGRRPPEVRLWLEEDEEDPGAVQGEDEDFGGRSGGTFSADPLVTAEASSLFGDARLATNFASSSAVLGLVSSDLQRRAGEVVLGWRCWWW